MFDIIDNINKTLKEDLQQSIHKGSKISIAAACFSIYAYQELKKQLEGIEELRFIFTSPTFIAEKTPKAQREFYIPRLSRERSIYGTEFEVKLCNKLIRCWRLLNITNPATKACWCFVRKSFITTGTHIGIIT